MDLLRRSKSIFIKKCPCIVSKTNTVLKKFSNTKNCFSGGYASCRLFECIKLSSSKILVKTKNYHSSFDMKTLSGFVDKYCDQVYTSSKSDYVKSDPDKSDMTHEIFTPCTTLEADYHDNSIQENTPPIKPPPRRSKLQQRNRKCYRDSIEPKTHREINKKSQSHQKIEHNRCLVYYKNVDESESHDDELILVSEKVDCKEIYKSPYGATYVRLHSESLYSDLEDVNLDSKLISSFDLNFGKISKTLSIDSFMRKNKCTHMMGNSTKKLKRLSM